MTVIQFAQFAKDYGIAFAAVAALAAAYWQLGWYVIKETVSKKMYEDLQASNDTNIAEAVKANTSSIEMLNLKVDERLPKKS